MEEVVTYFSDAHLHREEARRPITRPLRLSSSACRGRYLASPMTAGLVGTNGFVAIPTTAIDLPLVKRLRRSPRFWVRVPITTLFRHNSRLGFSGSDNWLVGVAASNAEA